MVAQEPTVNLDARYSNTQAAQLLGIHRHTLRSYTLSGAIKCGYRKATMRRFYLGSEILRLWRSQL